uniref:Uncharacterized protein n=1 Tax=Acanthochromis polyacanthus TaxID=80966 RepID=A0A3Q1F2T4_9TELE
VTNFKRYSLQFTKNVLLCQQVRMLAQAASDSNFGSLPITCRKQEITLQLSQVTPGVTSCSNHTNNKAPSCSSEPPEVSDETHLKDQQWRSLWSNTGGFDSGNTATFSSSVSTALPPFLSSADPFITQTSCVF